MSQRCSTQMRFRPSADGEGYENCPNRARVRVVFTAAKSKMMRGPFYLCAPCAAVFEPQLHVEGVETIEYFGASTVEPPTITEVILSSDDEVIQGARRSQR